MIDGGTDNVYNSINTDDGKLLDLTFPSHPDSSTAGTQPIVFPSPPHSSPHPGLSKLNHKTFVDIASALVFATIDFYLTAGISVCVTSYSRSFLLQPGHHSYVTLGAHSFSLSLQIPLNLAKRLHYLGRSLPPP